MLALSLPVERGAQRLGQLILAIRLFKNWTVSLKVPIRSHALLAAEPGLIEL